VIQCSRKNFRNHACTLPNYIREATGFHDDITAAQRKKERKKTAALRHSQRRNTRAHNKDENKRRLVKEKNKNKKTTRQMFVASPQNSGAANSRVRKTERAANEVAFSYLPSERIVRASKPLVVKDEN